MRYELLHILAAHSLNSQSFDNLLNCLFVYSFIYLFIHCFIRITQELPIKSSEWFNSSIETRTARYSHLLIIGREVNPQVTAEQTNMPV